MFSNYFFCFGIFEVESFIYTSICDSKNKYDDLIGTYVRSLNCEIKITRLFSFFLDFIYATILHDYGKSKPNETTKKS